MVSLPEQPLQPSPTVDVNSGIDKTSQFKEEETDLPVENEKNISTTSKQVPAKVVFSFAKTPKVKFYIFMAMFCGLFSGLVFPGMAFYFAQAFEELAASTSKDDFLKSVRGVAFAFMILGGVMFFALSSQTMFMETAAGEMTREFKTSWFQALLRQDMAFYDLQDISGQATIIERNGAMFHKGVGRKLVESFQYTISFIGAFVYAFWASWRISLLVLATVPFMSLAILFLVKMNTTQTSRASATYAKAGGIVSTSVSSIRTILSLNAVESVIEKYKKATTESLQGAVSGFWLLGLANGVQYAAFLLSYIVVTLYGTWILYKNVIDTGCDPSGTVEGNPTCQPDAAVDIFGALMGISFAAAVIPQVSVAIEAFTGARSACYPALVAMTRRSEDESDGTQRDVEAGNKTQTIYDELANLPNYVIDSSSKKGLQPKTVTGEIEFRNVHFSYPARAVVPVLRGFSLKIPPGKTVALVGVSGSGKSTVVQLMERFYDPTSGSISLDGHELRDLNVTWLRQHIGLVLQEPKLFAKSIRENISLGAPGITQEQVEEAAKKANAHDFIVSFPRGYDTQVGDLGSQLSGGQKQRIAIARVLCRQPKIILLDEATSALDSESEAAVQQALDRLIDTSNVTTFVIAHRLSTIKNSDIIAVVDNGEVVESGSHDELIAKEARYFELVQAQATRASQNLTKNESTLSTTPSTTPDISVHDNGLQADPSEMIAEPLDLVRKPLIQLKDVHFRYPARKEIEVFRGFNLSVYPGETLALVGPSGSGKSSVVQLIECFYRPTRGTIEYNGVDMRDINMKWLRSQFGLVSQEATLFNTSIFENIRFGCPNATMDQVVKAAKRANCHSFITSFPDGYNTKVGEGSALVSGGQKQRIAIARAIVRSPTLFLLDEATSALDSESEKIVQAALDDIMSHKDQTCIVIAHRLSTLRNADRIAVIDEGKVREIGTHEELMAKPNGRYKRLQELQNLHIMDDEKKVDEEKKKTVGGTAGEQEKETKLEEAEKEEEEVDVTQEEEKVFSQRAWLLGYSDMPYIVIGAIGAICAGFFFPAWGFVFAFMIEVLYQRVEACPSVVYAIIYGFPTCSDYQFSIASFMWDLAMDVFYGYIGLIGAAMIGNCLLFWGFGSASERMNKRVRDAAFTSLLRQEVGYFDIHSCGAITSQFSDDAALLHAFSGEPIRTLVLNLSSVFVGIIISFVYMWPFALLTLAITPFLVFGAEMEMKTYYGEDEKEVNHDETTPGGIVLESIGNMRTIASLSLEKDRIRAYDQVLTEQNKNPLRSNFLKGSAAGLGQFLQFWGFAIMFWWGGWVMLNMPDQFTYRDYLISMFSLFFGLYGLTIAAQGAVDRTKAKAAAKRIFALTDRSSEIDPIDNKGKKDIHYMVD